MTDRNRRNVAIGGGTSSKTLVMGIVNVTPDSFSDGGRFYDPKDAIEHAYRLVEEGADVIDVGAESTRPGCTPVPEDEEWRRLEPVLRELCAHAPVPISVDTFKAATAARALELGADIINDVWGGLADPRMLQVVADAGCVYIWMHNRREPAPERAFDVLVEETRAGVARCLEAGIAEDKLWIDPGIGFAKTYDQNLQILRRLSEYCALGWPVLLGTSRKGVIGRTLGTSPADRLEGSLATVAWGVAAGVRMVRVHDVLATVRTCRMVEAIRDARD
ncbi:dihydropteroate synthase [Alicyclobacillus macrosporangiidus]|uniref:dihydropteroate synthase n=1 Tax=Alicyclobacillus macrosporangiidus TaxID=392015 RepID=UPI0026EF433A|nr:dihydropteroate synthase [Alicyclobacillus macrosporangiidus]